MSNKPKVIKINDILDDLKAKYGDVAIVGDHAGWHVKIMRWNRSMSNAEKASNAWEPVTVIYSTPELAITAAMENIVDTLQTNKA